MLMLVEKFIFLIYLIGKAKKAIWSVSLGFFVQVRKTISAEVLIVFCIFALLSFINSTK